VGTENVSASNFTAMEASAEDNMQQLSEFDSSQIKDNGQIWRRGVVPAWMDLNGRNGRDASNLCDRIKRDWIHEVAVVPYTRGA
jgi:hypothetical protein